MEILEINEKRLNHYKRTALVWLSIYTVLQLILAVFDLNQFANTLQSFSQDMLKTKVYLFTLNNYHNKIINLSLLVVSLFVLIVTLLNYTKDKQYRRGLIVVFSLWTTNVIANLVYMMINQILYKDILNSNQLYVILSNISSLVNIIVFILLYQALIHMNKKQLKNSYIGLALLFLINLILGYISNNLLFKSYLSGYDDNIVFSIYMFQYIYTTVLNLISWIVLYKLTTLFIKHYVTDSITHKRYNRIILAIFWFIISFILFVFVEKIMIETRDTNGEYLILINSIKVTFSSIPMIGLVYLPIYLLKNVHFNVEQVNQKRSRPKIVVTGLIILIVPLFSWLTLFVKSQLSINDPYIDMKYIPQNKIEKRQELELEGKTYLLYTVDKFTHPSNVFTVKYIVLDVEKNSAFGFKKYDTITGFVWSDRMYTTSDCDEVCYGFVYGQNSSRYQEAVVTLSNDQTMTVNLDQNDWFIVRFEYHSGLYIRKVEYR